MWTNKANRVAYWDLAVCKRCILRAWVFAIISGFVYTQGLERNKSIRACHENCPESPYFIPLEAGTQAIDGLLASVPAGRLKWWGHWTPSEAIVHHNSTDYITSRSYG
jgi:hypothetical protein